MSVALRPFRPDDLPRLKEITVEAFDGVSIDQGIEAAFGTIGGHDWRWRKARHLDDDVARDAEGIRVAHDQGRIIGFVTTWIDVEAGIGHVPNLAITAAGRGQGLGRRLLQWALDRFRAAGITHARIETVAQNEIGRHLYPSLGFQEVARQIHFCAEL